MDNSSTPQENHLSVDEWLMIIRIFKEAGHSMTISKSPRTEITITEAP